MATVLATFSVLKDHVKLKVTQDSVAIDNIIFRLHYRATVVFLLAGSLLVCSRQFIGQHISCITDSTIPSNVIETYCFFTSTYTVVKHMNVTAVENGDVPHPGVGTATEGDEIVHHAYYQWVPFILFFQAILFYLPHLLWKSTEGGRMKALVGGLHMVSLAMNDKELQANGITVPSKQERADKISQIRTSFLNRLHVNRPWAYYLGLCEVLNLMNVILQFYVTDKFLGGTFLSLGNSVVNGDFEKKLDPLDVVFPKVTKCLFHKYGPTGTIQKHDALCVMALNVVNEKIYLFLWFWLIILTILSFAGLMWRLITMILHSRSKYFNKVVFSMACPGKNNPWSVLAVTQEYYYSDWLFLYYIAKNLDNYVFRELFLQLAEDMDERREARYRQSPTLTFDDEFEKQPLSGIKEQ